MYQNDMFPPKSDWRPIDTLPEFSGADAAVVDVETRDPGLSDHGPGWPMRNGEIVGVAMTLIYGEEKKTFYLPVNHRDGGNMDKRWVMRYVSAVCQEERITKIFHNALYDIGWLSTEGIEIRGPIYDTMFAAALLDENRYSYSLDNLAKDWCGIGKDETLLNEACAAAGYGKNAKANLWKLHARYVGPYGEGDGNTTEALWRHTRERLRNEGLWDLFVLEINLIPMLIEMRQRGIRVDEQHAEKAGKGLRAQFKSILKEIYRKFDCHIDVWTNDSIAKAFDSAGLDYPRSPTGLPSFVKDFLENHDHELPRMIRRARQIAKTENTFIVGMIEKQSVKGRIHCELHPLKSDTGGTVSGRFSCSNPNLQQASKRDKEFGPLVRGLFLPEPGCKWVGHDYSSQEPRLTVHYAALTHQNGAAEALAGYAADARTDYHQMVADLCGIARTPAKAINLGLAYGMGEVLLCRSLGLPVETVESLDKDGNVKYTYDVAGHEGKALIELYHEKVPFIQGLTNQCSNLASDRGYIKTLLGRRCRFDRWEKIGVRRGKTVTGRAEAVKELGNGVRRAMTHKAMNRLIQGSAADQTKEAMRAIYNEGIVPILQMHDELDFSSDSEHEMKVVKEIMETCCTLLIPSVVDTDVGGNWAEATYGDTS